MALPESGKRAGGESYNNIELIKPACHCEFTKVNSLPGACGEAI